MSRRREVIDQPVNPDGVKYRIRWGGGARFVKREIIQNEPTSLENGPPVDIESLKMQIQDQFTSSDHRRKSRGHN